MTQDEIIWQNEVLEMARQAGFIIHEFQGRKWTREPHTGCDLDPNLEAFAKLVAAKEREACAKRCEELEKAWVKAGLWRVTHEYKECSAAIRERGEA